MRGRPAHVALLKDSLISSRHKPSICSQCSLAFARHNVQISSQYSRPSYSTRKQSTWAAAVQTAQAFIQNAGKEDPVLPGGVKIDPFQTVAREMKGLTSNIRSLVGSGHPMLDTVAKYYTQSEGKHIRPMLVLLMSQATAHAPKAPIQHLPQDSLIDSSIASEAILSDHNPSIPSLTADQQPSLSDALASSSDILPSQRRLAEITELIHTASLLHDDVIDRSSTRRGSPSANIEFGNKMAVLAGDFLLGRASVSLARLRHSEVTELLSTVIANLIEGEFMQLQNTLHDERDPQFIPGQTIEYYLQKTYLKSASLISKSCRAAALLGQSSKETVDSAYDYGRNLGLAFQLVDDMLDFSVSAQELGKPAGADLELGLATAPLLFAWQTRPELGVLVGRKFEREGDVKKVCLSCLSILPDDNVFAMTSTT